MNTAFFLMKKAFAERCFRLLEKATLTPWAQSSYTYGIVILKLDFYNKAMISPLLLQVYRWARNLGEVSLCYD